MKRITILRDAVAAPVCSSSIHRDRPGFTCVLSLGAGERFVEAWLTIEEAAWLARYLTRQLAEFSVSIKAQLASIASASVEETKP